MVPLLHYVYVTAKMKREGTNSTPAQSCDYSYTLAGAPGLRHGRLFFTCLMGFEPVQYNFKLIKEFQHLLYFVLVQHG